MNFLGFDIPTWMIPAGIAIIIYICKKMFIPVETEEKYFLDNKISMAKETEKEEYETCDKCKKKVYEDKEGDIETYTCEECNDNCCNDCCIKFKESENICCKECIDKVYPRKIEYREKIIEKVIEKPIIKVIDKEGNSILNLDKSKFD